MTGAAAVLDPPVSPTVDLAFAAGEADARLPLPCTSGESYEVTVIMVNAPSARAIHARMRYADEAEFSHDITHVVSEDATGGTLFASAQARGLPCVELVAEGADGRRSEPTVVCEAVGCAEGGKWSEGLGRDVEWWRREYGPTSCVAAPVVSEEDPAQGCACVGVTDAHGAQLGAATGLLVLLVLLRRPRMPIDLCPRKQR
jgi:hypothetical protein